MKQIIFLITSITFYNKYFHLSQKYKFTADISVSYVYVPWVAPNFSSTEDGLNFWGLKFCISIFIYSMFLLGGGSEIFLGYEDFCGYFWCHF